VSPPVDPSFIEELARLNKNAGVSRQKLASQQKAAQNALTFDQHPPPK
jgi:hypothetical protein